MDIWEKISSLRRSATDVVVITITAVRGSVPGQVGGKAVVSADGMVAGNLGGGKVEAKAVAQAMAMLGGAEACTSVVWNLQKDVGMTCGGEMSFLFEHLAAQPSWHIAIFGAGHVSQALVPVLASLSCRLDVFDTRADWLAKLPVLEKVSVHCVSSFEEGVGQVTDRSFVLAITHGHSSDRPVLRSVLEKFPCLPFIGVIGSASKRAVLMRELKGDGIADELLSKIVCPLGLPLGGNDPAEISISIAAQLLQVRDCPVAGERSKAIPNSPCR